jgi:hypothetical protein
MHRQVTLPKNEGTPEAGAFCMYLASDSGWARARVCVCAQVKLAIACAVASVLARATLLVHARTWHRLSGRVAFVYLHTRCSFAVVLVCASHQTQGEERRSYDGRASERTL